ncbi:MULTISPECIES: hypothetical protein [unclassified Moorena]|uniref:hypothetical protein n=1 Tax=unclassified Moorena TaxID=2683338 RepID=UPI0013C0F6B1|nr:MULTISPECIES: hypothetical protein [unclassified Moorena]NEO08888.1 hypothetical protein [Moorena sp. SIO3I8]NEP25657.1 hypothetical protein [Moorena sp. SIO3I6]
MLSTPQGCCFDGNCLSAKVTTLWNADSAHQLKEEKDMRGCSMLLALLVFAGLLYLIVNSGTFERLLDTTTPSERQLE